VPKPPPTKVGAARVEDISTTNLLISLKPIGGSEEAVDADLIRGINAFMFDFFFSFIVAPHGCAIEMDISDHDHNVDTRNKDRKHALCVVVSVCSTRQQTDGYQVHEPEP
jgi:hypothetical protein